jgi:hypothetical protein
LERNLSALAEEACDNAVLARGHNPRDYAEYLLDIARSVARSGARLHVTGMAMPGSFLQQRIRRILEGGQAPRISRTRMACVAVACAVTCAVFAAGTLDHAQESSPAMAQSDRTSAAHPAAKFVLGDLKIEGDVHDRNGVRDRILKAWQGREADGGDKLADEVAIGVRRDFQERGYFKVVVDEPKSQPLGLRDGTESTLILISITEGDQFRLGTLTIQNVDPDHPLIIPEATLRNQIHLHAGGLFNILEIQTGLERLRSLYAAYGYADMKAQPATHVDDASHRIDLGIRFTEGPHGP